MRGSFLLALLCLVLAACAGEARNDCDPSHQALPVSDPMAAGCPSSGGGGGGGGGGM